jgi:hypothetical protein
VLGDAAQLYEAATSVYLELGAKPGLACALEGFASIAAARGAHERALQLAGAAARMRADAGIPLPPPDQQDLERWLAPSREALGTAAAELAVERGTLLELDRALDLARR